MSRVELSPHALCQPEDVERLVPGYEFDEPTEDVIIDLINSESDEAHNDTGREFIATDPPGSERLFDLTEWECEQREVMIGDLATTAGLALKTKDLDGTVIDTITSGYLVLPRRRQAWEPITSIWFPTRVTSPATLSLFTVLSVAGTWGFPMVPDRLRVGIAKLVLVRYINDVANSGTQLAEATAELNIGGMYVSAREAIDSFRIPMVG